MRHRRTVRGLGLAAGMLVLGAVTTVGVAWGCTAATALSKTETYPKVRSEVAWVDPSTSVATLTITHVHGFGAKWKDVLALRPFGIDVQDDRVIVNSDRSISDMGRKILERSRARPAPARVIEEAGRDDYGRRAAFLAGWPALCVYFGCSQPSPLPAGTFGDLRVRSWRLPLLPLWPGLAADTAFYAGAWSLLLLAPRHIRRVMRKRCRACVGCGYDLAGLAVEAACPECGRDRGGKSA